MTSIYPDRTWTPLGALAGLLLVLGTAGYEGYCCLRAEASFRAAEAACRGREFGRARGLLEAYLKDWPASARAHLLLARVARSSGLFLLAGRELDTCQRLQGPTESIALQRALLQAQQGALTAALESRLRLYLEHNHAEADQILEALSVGCLTSYRFPAARAYLNAWLERSPDNVQAYIWRSLVHEHLLDVIAAREDGRKAVALAAANPDARLRLAQALLLTTEVEEAAELFERLHQEQPANAVVVLGLARAQAKRGRTEAAEHLLDELAARFPSDAAVLLERGRLALQGGQAAAAEPWLREAAARAPADYQTHYSLLLCLRQLGKEAAAGKVQENLRRLEADGARLRELAGQLQQYPYDLSARCAIAHIYLDQGQDREAVLWLQSALKIDPNYRPANQSLAAYYENSGQPALAAPYRRPADPAGAGDPLAPGEALPSDGGGSALAPLPNSQRSFLRKESPWARSRRTPTTGSPRPHPTRVEPQRTQRAQRQPNNRRPIDCIARAHTHTPACLLASRVPGCQTVNALK